MPEIAYLDLCASITIFMLIISIFIRKQLFGRTNMLFLAICYCILVSGITDIFCLSLEQIVTDNSLTIYLHYLSSYIYFIVRNFTAPVYVLYVCSQIGLWHKIERGRPLYFFWLIPYAIDIIVILSNPFNHKVFVIDPATNAYSRGPLMLIMYVIAFYYIILGLAFLIRYRKHLVTYRFVLLIAFMPLNAIAVLIQMAARLYRVEIMATTMLALVIAIGVQRPEEMIDPVVRTMSNNAFIIDMRTSFNSHRPMSVLLIHFTNHGTLRNNLGLFSYNILLKRLANKINQISKIMKIYPDFYYLDGGSFAVISSVKDSESLLDLGRMIHAYMQEPVRLNHMEIMVNTVSCIVKCPEDISSHQEFMTFSRSFQHKIKDSNRVAILSEIIQSKDFVIRNRIDNIISRAIAERRFEMHYQPIYSIKEHKFVSAEALIRLNDPEFGYVSPALFIPAAESNGAIHQIGDFVIEDVCRFISSYDFKGLGLKYIELNLSVAQCIEADFSQKVQNILMQHGVSPDKINLEITETAVDYDPETTDANIAELAKQGFTFSLDDYGTGYSNIKRVVSLPLSIVKLDKCLVDDMDNNQMWIVIKNTVRMLQRINKNILVEGVENDRAFHKFEEIGCDYIQGYYFSKPLNESDFILFLMQHNVLNNPN